MMPTGDAARAVLFDVDGTLVDTNYLHAVTWWEAFRQSGHTVSMPAIHRTVGMGSDKLLDRLLGEDRDRSGDDRIVCAHKTLYASYFTRLSAFEGAGDLVRAVADHGWRVVLASSASAEELAAMRAAIGADEAIDDATSADDVGASKPAPDLVREALRLADVPADQAVFIGDTVWDVRACDEAGVPCIALLSGGIPRADLEEAGAVEVYEGPADLLSRIDLSLLAR